MWKYECKNGVYAADSLFKLLWLMFTHRLEHLMRDGKYMD